MVIHSRYHGGPLRFLLGRLVPVRFLGKLSGSSRAAAELRFTRVRALLGSRERGYVFWGGELVL